MIPAPATGFGTLAAPLDDEAYHLLNELLEERFGLHFPLPRRSVLETRLQNRLRALHLDDFLEYYAVLRANGTDESRELAKAITNNETYFFRERDQLDALFADGLAALAEMPAVPGRIRLLSAGCSSGEEAYTLSFLAAERAVARGLPVEIDGLDLDTDRVTSARRAEYRVRSLRQMTDDQIRRYLAPATGSERWTVREPYRRAVQFDFGNLVDDAAIRRRGPYDAVFCRNVLIYFSATSMRRAVENLVSVLRPGGLLFLGHSESAIGLLPNLETARLGNCIVYRKVVR
jgi:chemotaxis protein methyltransferase CheR